MANQLIIAGKFVEEDNELKGSLVVVVEVNGRESHRYRTTKPLELTRDFVKEETKGLPVKEEDEKQASIFWLQLQRF